MAKDVLIYSKKIERFRCLRADLGLVIFWGIIVFIGPDPWNIFFSFSQALFLSKILFQNLFKFKLNNDQKISSRF